MDWRKIAKKGCKERGEWAELQFMARAAGEGFLVSRPWGDSACYDVGLEFRRRYMRVQVKSTIQPRRGDTSFRVGLIGPGGEPYKVGQIDFVAVYLISIDRWYIFPVRLLRSKNARLRVLQITPGSPRGRWFGFEDRWDLLRKKKKPGGTWKKHSQAE
jgi:hypothetical protein